MNACALIENEAGNLYLSVTRKNNHSDFGLPGGKYDPDEDMDLVDTALRETVEETGMNVEIITTIEPYIEDDCYTYFGRTTLIPDTEINLNETGKIGFVSEEVLQNQSSFGKYNKRMFQHFKNLGVI